MDTTLTIIMLTLKRLGTVQIYVSVKIQNDKKTAQRQRRKHTLEHTKNILKITKSSSRKTLQLHLYIQ